MQQPRLFIAALILCGCSFDTGNHSVHAEESASQDIGVLQASLTRFLQSVPEPDGFSLGDIIRDGGDNSEEDESSNNRRYSLETADQEAQEKERNDRESKRERDEEASRIELTKAHLELLRKPITDLEIQATAAGEVPKNRAAIYVPKQPLLLIAATDSRLPGPDRYTAGFRHQPLYFEQPNLERCGRGFRYLQNPISGFQFLANIMVLPYHMCAQPAACTISSRGDCLACQKWPVDCDPFPIDHKGLVTEAAAIAGFSFLLL